MGTKELVPDVCCGNPPSACSITPATVCIAVVRSPCRCLQPEGMACIYHLVPPPTPVSVHVELSVEGNFRQHVLMLGKAEVLLECKLVFRVSTHLCKPLPTCALPITAWESSTLPDYNLDIALQLHFWSFSFDIILLTQWKFIQSSRLWSMTLAVFA